ncbi:MAG: enoyl-CoA hydratase/isomerase family protein [Halieaceae bacterium]|nr:enoyl-CoA hydratase/isomerase family protein [Halieaceae bacterium]
MRDPEFSEGVRALLIDKDKSPNWQFPDVNSVPNDKLEKMFAPPWPKNPLADLDT